ncbi:hypothetical protein [Halorubrum tailed virus BLv36]|nr:hypothetical protein [Halorubrum tailed virus BLv36]
MSRNLQEELPEEVEERAKSIKEDNPDMAKSSAIAIARDQLNMAEKYDSISLEEDPCWDGYVMVGTKQENGQTVPNCVPEEDADPANLESNDCPEGHIKIGDECVPVEEVDTAVNVLSEPTDKRVMSTASPLDTQPIEREELSNGTVAYRNIKLLDEGVWTDESSRTPTLYDERTFENLEILSPEGMDGPPVNVAHDLDSNGEPNEASVGGYIDPDSVDTDGKALFGDIMLDTGDPAGAYLDENLKSSLESNGEVGFSPSVELMPTELEAAEHPQAEQHVVGAEFTGTALVRDPASKSVDFAHETRNRQIAMGLEGQTAKRLEEEPKHMAEIEEVRETLDSAGLGDVIDDMTDDEVMDMAENLHSDLMADLEGEEVEAEYDEEEEEEEEKEMADADELMAELDEVRGRVAELEDMVAGMDGMVEEEDLEEATEELADASDVEEIEKTLSAIMPDGWDTEEVSRALKAVGEEPEKPRSLADGSDEEPEYNGRIVGVSDPDPY